MNRTQNAFELSSVEIRKIIVDVAYQCGQASHIGGSLSMVELLNCLFAEVLKHDPRQPEWPDRDVFILSKGHAVLGYLAVLHYFGYFDREKLLTFQTNGSDFIAHPVKKPSLGIESSNGSLGQGLSYGLGLALGMSKRQQNRFVYVLVGDGECNEGSVWETAASASELKAGNLIAVVDENGFRNDGENTTYRSRIKMSEIWKSFGWEVFEVDGHDHDQIAGAFLKAKESRDQPSVLVAKTVKGKGIDFMEGNNDWHHNRITANIYEQCLQALTGDSNNV